MTNKNKLFYLIILFGFVFFVFIILLFILKEKFTIKQLLIEKTQLKEKKLYIPPPADLWEKKFIIWCENLYTDCTEYTEYEPGEILAIGFNLEKFAIPYKDFYYCYSSDLLEDNYRPLSKCSIPFTLKDKVFLSRLYVPSINPKKDFNLFTLSIYPLLDEKKTLIDDLENPQRIELIKLKGKILDKK